MTPIEAGHPATRDRMPLAYYLYNAFLALLMPGFLIALGISLLRGKYRDHLRERFGRLPAALAQYGAHDDPVIWVQAASVGEVNAATPILRELRVRLPLAHLLLSVTTPTGREVAEKRDLGLDGVFYFPFDEPPWVRGTLRSLKPDMLVMVETELWPNLLAQCHALGIPTVVVNGRISDRALPRAKALWPIYRMMMRYVDLICAQSEVDAERFRLLGAVPERVTVTGNSKFDDTPPSLSPAEAARWRQEFGFGDEDLVLVAGSTHEGEEEMILDIFDHLRFTHHNLQLVLAPRHPVRGDRVHDVVREHGYDVYRRSHVVGAREAGEEHPAPPTGPTVRVVILDTVGELVSVYGCADVVIVGGSLVRGLAGHNILEPIAQNKPTLCGPYMADFRDIAALALREGCAVQVSDAAGLQSQCERLLSDAAARNVDRGPQMIDKYAGASARCAEAVERLLGVPQLAPVPEPEAAAPETEEPSEPPPAAEA